MARHRPDGARPRCRAPSPPTGDGRRGRPQRAAPVCMRGTCAASSSGAPMVGASPGPGCRITATPYRRGRLGVHPPPRAFRLCYFLRWVTPQPRPVDHGARLSPDEGRTIYAGPWFGRRVEIRDFRGGFGA